MCEYELIDLGKNINACVGLERNKIIYYIQSEMVNHGSSSLTVESFIKIKMISQSLYM